MKVSEEVKKKIDKFEPGKIITYTDFNLSEDKFKALAKALSRFSKIGVLERFSKGCYYKPKKTIFGNIKPSESEIIEKSIIIKNKINGYITGNNVYNNLGLTTQISNEIIISTNKPRKAVTRNNIKVRFVTNNNKIIKSDIDKLQILDVIKNIKKIPDKDTDKVISVLISKISSFSLTEKKRIFILSLNYNPATRALIGAIFELINETGYSIKLKKTLNSLTKYNIQVSNKILTNKRSWNIQ